ncbi:MAG TPA: hypothetical protein VE860_25465 [Chthoniobacterales bacterium]|nr:hypothetical protein [Chthoniobacterales bacterium]
MYLRVVRGEALMPSLTSSSFAILSSPHSELSRDISRIKRRSSAGIGGRPGSRPDEQTEIDDEISDQLKEDAGSGMTSLLCHKSLQALAKSWHPIFCGGQPQYVIAACAAVETTNTAIETKNS